MSFTMPAFYPRIVRRAVAVCFVLFVSLSSATAQISISHDILKGSESIVRLRVQEAESGAPIAYASVYIRAKNDTLITNFTLSDTSGFVVMNKVSRGSYVLTVEMLGYKSYNADYYFSKAEEDLGDIRLTEDIELLDAAHVTAIGNPIEVKQDTVIFNADSFRMGQNQMLEDLLRRIPGMDLSEDGSVRYNGEVIQKITVGGKTFFFDDPMMALRNLPAKIVDKIKIIDRLNDTEQFAGISGGKGKVMDIEFKREFKQGWFGNLRAGGGATISQENDMLTDSRGGLYTGNLLLAGYDEKDQLTLIGNSDNAPLRGKGDATISVAYTDDDGNTAYTASSGGLLSNSQAGVNYNTSRIPGVDLTGMVRYDRARRDLRNRKQRTDFLHDAPDIDESSQLMQSDRTDELKVNFELKNLNRERVLFQFAPILRYSQNHNIRSIEAQSYHSGSSESLIGSSQSSRSGQSNRLRHEADMSFGLRNIGDTRRSITVQANYYANDFEEEGRDSLRTEFFQTADRIEQYLRFRSGSQDFGSSINLTYVEPIADSWTLSASVKGNWTRRSSQKEVFNLSDGSCKGGYSADLRSTFDFYTETLQFQYRKNLTSLQLGGRLQETYQKNRMDSGRSESGGKYLFDWNPYVNFRYSGEGSSLSLRYSGTTIRPAIANLMPVLDISVPTDIHLGNLYLLPSGRYQLYFDFNRSNAKAFNNYSISYSASVQTRQTVAATWFDTEGIRYNVPVNSRKPGLAHSLQVNASFPLTSDKQLRVSGSILFGQQRSTSYQNVRPIDRIEGDSFDYADFMADFWGDESGSRFYNGDSGYAESRTKYASLAPSLKLDWRSSRFMVSVSGGTNFGVAQYTIDPSADTQTWSSSTDVSFTWQLPREFELYGDCSYNFFSGFPQNFNKPYAKWDMVLTKRIRQFVLELNIYDILNASRSTQHFATANYVEDVQHNQLGRRIFLIFKWNFGKLNESNSQKANQAVWQMLY